LPGVIGNTPVIGSTVNVNDNLPFQYDFRSVYATLLENWLCVNNTDLQTIMLKNFQTLPLVNAGACKTVQPTIQVIVSNQQLPKSFPAKNHHQLYYKWWTYTYSDY
jgi:hypothetical protein